METKICSKCKEEKELNYFHKDIRLKSGHINVCKICRTAYSKTYVTSGKLAKNKRIINLKNQCFYCKEKRLTTSKFCLYHFVRKIVFPWRLQKSKIEETIQGLIKKLEDGEYCCHYSGLKVTPGFSASVDHRIPQSKGGTHDLTNLVWCHVQVNKLKNDMTEKQFINRSANILVELNYLDSKGQL